VRGRRGWAIFTGTWLCATRRRG